MTAPSESRAPQPSRTPTRAPAAAPGARDRLFQALVALVDDLTVERDEAGLLSSALEHIVGLARAHRRRDLRRAAQTASWSRPPSSTSRSTSRPCASWPRPRWSRTARWCWTSRARGCWRRRRCGRRGARSGRWCSTRAAWRETGLDREVLEVLGKQLGTGLDNVQLYAELRASSARGEALRRITAAATSGSELAAIIPAFAARARRRCSRSTASPAASSTRPATTSRW